MQGIETVSLAGKKIILGVTGGIAAYKAAELCRLLVKAGADVRVASAGIKMIPVIGHAAAVPTDVCAGVIDP